MLIWNKAQRGLLTYLRTDRYGADRTRSWNESGRVCCQRESLIPTVQDEVLFGDRLDLLSRERDREIFALRSHLEQVAVVHVVWIARLAWIVMTDKIIPVFSVSNDLERAPAV